MRQSEKARWAASAMLALAFIAPARADQDLRNWGNDPFFQISHAVADCPQPLGPLLTRQEWQREEHYRAERGNSCYIQGTCRLSSGYRYDGEISEAVKRRLTHIAEQTQWDRKSTLWLMLQRRIIYVQGCVAADFDREAFVKQLAETADVVTVIDQMAVLGPPDAIRYPLAPAAQSPAAEAKP
ncbi:BON domain-containing protein [Acidovorax sp. BLS4]|uniref:BON domain-containing protein n=1 Tax=Acidovorax sp. BLS4 TaxID=3273430 RepID=UPI0029425DA6|nr:BON domain-containing protein [Paracidovorax avenae]WOI44619.1 BON domain-containing protein [Paracidovorax avenae]